MAANYGVPAAMQEQLMGAVWDEPVLALFELTSSGWSETLYLVGNQEDVTSNSQVFTAFPFMFVLPKDKAKAPFQMTVRTSNFDLELGRLIEETAPSAGIDAILRLVHNSDLDNPIRTINNLNVNSARADRNLVEFTLGLLNLSTIQLGRNRRRATHPGLY